MNLFIYELIAVGLVFIIFGLSFGFFLQKRVGAWMIGLSALIASTFTGVSAVTGYFFGDDFGAWIGLLTAIVFTVPLMALALKLGTFLMGIPIHPGVRRFMRWQWLGLWTLALFGHWAGGWVGLFTLSLPAYILYWLGLLRTAPYTLPLRDRGQKNLTVRSLITNIMGTNYPYFFLSSDGLLQKRIDGNPYLAFFAGPGITYTDSDHAVFVSDGVYKNRVFEPGLGFTDKFDQEPRLVDLRPQFRQFTVRALTRDDIRVDAEIHVQYRIDNNNQLPKLGASFPLNRQAIQTAMASDLIENDVGQIHDVKKHEWDGQLVCLIMKPILRDIIGRYRFDDLFGPDNHRSEISADMVQKISSALQSSRLQLLACEIGNLILKDEIIVEKRLEDWRTQWEGRILGELDPKMHEYLLELERARTESDLIKVLALVAQKGKEIHHPTLLRLVAELEEVSRQARRK
jgi:hypothetical protein